MGEAQRAAAAGPAVRRSTMRWRGDSGIIAPPPPANFVPVESKFALGYPW